MLLLTDVGGLLNARGIELGASRLTPRNLGALVGLVHDGTLNSKTAKTVLEDTLDSGTAPAEIVKSRGLAKISDPAQLGPIVQAVVDSNARAVADYRSGKTAALEALFGQVMGRTRGQADPAVARELLQQAVAE